MPHFLLLLVLKAVPVMFAGAFIASYFEKKFQYSLFDTIIGIFKKKVS